MGNFNVTQRPKHGSTSSSALHEDILDTNGDMPSSSTAPLLELPPEIIQQILSHLQCQPLVSLGRTCKRLKKEVEADLLWANLLRPQLPPSDYPDTPFPCDSYRDLYISHHPYWFLPRHKIWFSDDRATGKIMLVRFDPRRGCIEGYRLLAERGNDHFEGWSRGAGVTIHCFKPHVHVWLDDPLLQLNHDPAAFNNPQGWWSGEIKMTVGRQGHNTSASFFLTREIPLPAQVKAMELWPPTTIPNMPRVRAASGDNFRDPRHKPQTHDEIAQTAFRLRVWSQFTVSTSSYGIRLGEQVNTWSTLDPELYTPTKEKPFQGIFVGDYAGHGCEFLLVLQTKKAPPPPVREVGPYFMDLMTVSDGEDESENESEHPDADVASDTEDTSRIGVFDADVHRGAIEAIKLTGDINVPRGQHTFIADDIGPAGYIRTASEAPFQGARVVRSRGHVAARGFQSPAFVPSQLFLISPDTLAQYWIAFGHISYYRRVDIDQILQSTWRT